MSAAWAQDGCTVAERIARAALSAAVEPADGAVLARVVDRGPVAVLRELRGGSTSLDRRGVVKRRIVGVDGEALLADATAAGLRFVCPGDAEWPDALGVLDESLDAAEPVPPAFGLWLRGAGRLPELVRRSVAVVGSRAATSYGERVAADLGADFAIAGWTVVSGAAYGIDAAAHRGALALGGATVAVVACGADVAYPRPHADLLDRIAEAGVVVSELPPGSHPTRTRFLARNRLIAGLTAGTVVVEAALRSGALNTATWARKLSREVLAVPGPVTSALSAGCHDLLRKDGVLVTAAGEVIDAVGQLGGDMAPLPEVDRRELDRFPVEQRDVFDAIPRWQAISVEALSEKTGVAAGELPELLARFERAGLVSVGLDGWRLRRRPR